MKSLTFSLKTLAGLCACVLVLAGCDSTPLTPPAMPSGRVDNKVKELYTPEAEAGVALSEENAYADMDNVRELAQKRAWSSRGPGAFALLASERKFEQEQTLERMLGEMNFLTEYELPDPAATEVVPTTYPTPAWRLAGIVVSEGAVIALLDQGNRVDTIVPGQMVEGTEWRCVAIDTEKAVFRRAANLLPNEIVVPLQGSIPGNMGGGGGGPQGGEGGRPGGRPESGGGPGAPTDDR